MAQLKYHLAKSLEALRNELNTKYPKRDKASDGWIGDAAHSARISDHNPDYNSGGVVRAIDVDKDGIDVDELLNAVIYDPRVSYVIWNGRIWGGSRWRKYEGSNQHTKHIHISIKHTAAAERAGSWGISSGSKPKPSTPKVSKQTTKNRPNGSTTFPTDYEDLKIEGKWDDLRQGAIQILMHQLGYKINKQWDGKIASLGVKDLMNWLQDVGYYIKTPVTKFGTRRGVKLYVDGDDGQWFWYEFQRYLADRKFYKGVLDGNPKVMTFEAIERWLNANNGS